jgi:hypothetical protein
MTRETGQLRETLLALRDSGFAGSMSLEPHLDLAGRHGGFSGRTSSGVPRRR